MLAELFQHVIEEADTGVDLRITRAIEIDVDPNGRFPCSSLDGACPRIVQEKMGDPLPALFLGSVDRDSVTAQAEVVGKLGVGIPVPDDG